jgi:hypothetical protein
MEVEMTRVTLFVGNLIKIKLRIFWSAGSGPQIERYIMKLDCLDGTTSG